MTIGTDLDPDTRALLRGVDPLHRADLDADEGPDTDGALHALLARADEEASATSRRDGHRRRRALQLGVVAAGAVAATVVAVNIASSGGGPVSSTLDRSGVGVAPAHAGTLAARVRRALAGAPGGILEVELQMSGRKAADDPSSAPETIHYWDQSEAPHDQVMVDSAGGRVSVTGEHDGRLQYYDPATNAIGVMTPTPAVEAAQGVSPRTQALGMLARRGTIVDRRASFDGRPAIKLTSVGRFGVTTMYLAQGGYTPLEYRWDAAPGAPTDMRGGAVVQRYLIYRELTGAQARLSLVSLTAQHPTATVVDESAAAWNAAEGRLDP